MAAHLYGRGMRLNGVRVSTPRPHVGLPRAVYDRPGRMENVLGTAIGLARAPPALEMLILMGGKAARSFSRCDFSYCPSGRSRFKVGGEANRERGHVSQF